MIPSWKLAGVALLAMVLGGSAAFAQTNVVPQPSPLHSDPSTRTLPKFGTSADQPAKKQHARHGRGGAGNTSNGATTSSGN